MAAKPTSGTVRQKGNELYKAGQIEACEYFGLVHATMNDVRTDSTCQPLHSTLVLQSWTQRTTFLSPTLLLPTSSWESTRPLFRRATLV